MAITDTNITLVGNTPQDILLGTSSSFIVQNVSNNDLRFKISFANSKTLMSLFVIMSIIKERFRNNIGS